MPRMMRASDQLRLVGTTGIAALLLAVAPKANAQASAGEANANPSEATAVQPIVVTAQRRSENIQNVPIAIQAITGKQLQTLGIKQSTDIAQFTPNVTIALPDGEGNQPLINIRGVGLNDFDTNNAGPNGVYVDDIYISSPAEQTFALFDLSQVEVLKGPQGTLYGMNTSGGAVVFTSNKPTDYFTADLHLDYGEYNTVQFQGAVGGPLAQGLDGRLALVVNHSDGYMHNDLTDGSASGADNQALRLQLLYRPNDQLKVLFSSTVGYVHNKPTEYRHIGDFEPGTQGGAAPTVCSVARSYAGGCVDIFGYGTPSSFTGGSIDRSRYLSVFNLLDSLRVDYKAGSVTITSISAVQHSDKYFPEDSDGSPNNLIQATYGVKSTALTQELRASQTEKDFNWQAGVYYLHEDLTQTQNLSTFFDGDTFGGFGVPPGPGNFDGIAAVGSDVGKQTTDAYAIYGQGEYNLDNFTLTLGARYTYIEKSFDYLGSTMFQQGGIGNYGVPTDIIAHSESQNNDRFTWRAALAYHFTNHVLAYASAATGFKSGDFNGSFLSNVEQQAALQLKPVDPEDITAYELGFKSSFFHQRLVFNAAAFYYDYTNEQIFANVPQVVNNPVLGPLLEETEILANAHQAHTEGLEFQITAVPIDGLTIDLEPALLDAKIDHAGLSLFGGSVDLDGRQLANAPHVSFTGFVNYKFAIADGDHIETQFSSSYKSHQYFDSTNDPYTQQAGYWIHNFNISYQNRNGWDAGVYVKNLTDTHYLITAFDLTSAFGFVEGVIGQPRSYGVQFNYHF